MKQCIKLFLWLVVAYDALSCSQLYKAGNLVALDYPINTNIRTEIVQKFVDTLILKYGFEVPDKWKSKDKLVDLDSINHKRIYFKENPEEMYLISYGGMLVLNDVYNPSLNSQDWVSERKSLSEEEETRIKTRFEHDILKRVESLAKAAGMPDSVIYKK
jgi:hypothetical protein